MPLINVNLIDRVFSEPPKKQIATKLTGKTLSTADVKTPAAGPAAQPA